MADPSAFDDSSAAQDRVKGLESEDTQTTADPPRCTNKRCNCGSDTGSVAAACVEPAPSQRAASEPPRREVERKTQAPHIAIPRDADRHPSSESAGLTAAGTGEKTENTPLVDEPSTKQPQVVQPHTGQLQVVQPTANDSARRRSTEEAPIHVKEETGLPVKVEDPPRPHSVVPLPAAEVRSMPEMYAPMPPPFAAVHSPSQHPQNPHFQQPESQQGQQQCYCLMPVPSGMSQTPFVYQCVPIPTAMSGAIAHSLPVVQGPPGHIPSPLPTMSHMGPSPGVVGPMDPANNGMHTIATTLAQMKSSPHGTIESRSTPPSAAISPATAPLSDDAKAKGEEDKLRPHACKMQDNWGRACKRTFTRPYDLYRHQETVHGSGSKSFCCGMCGCKSKKFSRQDSLARHIRRMHRKVDPLEIRGLVATSVSSAKDDGSVSSAESVVNATLETPVSGMSGAATSVPSVSGAGVDTATIKNAGLSMSVASDAAANRPVSAMSGSTNESPAAAPESVNADGLVNKRIARTESAYDTESEESSNESETREFSEPRSKRLKTEFRLAAQTA